MKKMRNNIFETNSSSTHSLIISKTVYELPPREHKKNWKGKELPVEMDTPNFRVELREFYDGCDNSDLTVPEQNASYIFTMLHLMFNNENFIERHENSAIIQALGQLHIRLLENELIPKYGEICVKYHVYDYNLDGHYEDSPRVTPAWDFEHASMEQNDGGFIDSIEDIMSILDTPESLREFLTTKNIKIKYEG